MDPKSVGSLKPGDIPKELGRKGVPNPREKKRADHGFKILLGKYKKEMNRIVRGYITKGNSFKETKSLAKNAMERFFERAFVNGMRSAAGIKSTPSSFRIGSSHKKWIYSAVRREFEFFEKLLQDVRYKRVFKQHKRDWEDRIADYAKTLTSVRAAGEVAASPEDRTLFFWKLSDAEHCDGCLYMASISPLPKSSLVFTPRDGNTPCLIYCKCELKRSVVSKSRFERAVKSAPSAKTIERNMKKINRRHGKKGQTKPSRNAKGWIRSLAK